MTKKHQIHLVPQKLTQTPLWLPDAGRANSDDGEGAVYNDFDFDTTSLLSEAGNLCSQTSVHTPNTSMAPQDAVEFAILEADKSEGVLYEHTVHGDLNMEVLNVFF